MRTNLTIDDLGDLLELPIVAVLATYRADGSAMLSPVWFEWGDGVFNVWVGGANDGKARHVVADPRADRGPRADVSLPRRRGVGLRGSDPGRVP